MSYSCLWLYKLLASLLVLTLLVGCAPSIKYIQHSAPMAPKHSQCLLEVIQGDRLVPTGMQMIAEISVQDDTGLSMNCDEKTVMAIIREKACSIGADIVKLYNVRPPDFWGSPCFQAQALLLSDIKARDDQQRPDQQQSPNPGSGAEEGASQGSISPMEPEPSTNGGDPPPMRRKD